MANKLTNEELSELSEAHELYYDAKLDLANIFISEERLKTQKQLSLVNFASREATVEELMNKVKEKYGEGKVNLTTGDIS